MRARGRGKNSYHWYDMGWRLLTDEKESDELGRDGGLIVVP